MHRILIRFMTHQITPLNDSALKKLKYYETQKFSVQDSGHWPVCVIKKIFRVGKTSILKLYCDDKLTQNYKATIGVDLMTK